MIEPVFVQVNKKYTHIRKNKKRIVIILYSPKKGIHLSERQYLRHPLKPIRTTVPRISEPRKISTAHGRRGRLDSENTEERCTDGKKNSIRFSNRHSSLPDIPSGIPFRFGKVPGWLFTSKDRSIYFSELLNRLKQTFLKGTDTSAFN